MRLSTTNYLNNLSLFWFMDFRDQILQFIRIKGPVLPIQIAKDIKSDILMASAHLAELTATRKLKISTIKVGGSPLYYLQGQEQQLEKYTTSLNEKELKAFDLLKESKVLRDSAQEPVMRVALRVIKDFALQLNVNYDNKNEIFWKWHTLSDNEAEPLIKSILGIVQQKEQPNQPKPQEKIQETSQEVQEKINEKQKPAAKQEQKPKETKKPKPLIKDNFVNDITKFFEKNKISVISSELIKKDSEIDFVIDVPSVVGNLRYYCKAKNKKRISDSDLSNAYVKGQFRKLPVIVISNGELSSKAIDLMNKELNNLTFKKL